MALSGTVKTSAYDGRYYQVDWTATQSIANNTSTISWTLKAVGGSSSWYAERTLNVSVAGTSVFSKTDRVERYAGTIKTGTVTVSHNSSGAASFSISINAAVYTSSVNCTGTGSFTLNTIPRKSTLSVVNGTLGTAQTLTVTRKSTSFTHTITYACGSASGTICTKSSSTSLSFTPPLTLASQNTTGTSVNITYKIETYNGSTSIGSNSCTVTCTIPTSVKPTVSFTVSDAESLLSTYGAYVQGKSKFQIAITASGSYGSSIKSYNTTVDGNTYTTASITTDYIKNNGTLTIDVTVTDTRGRTATASKSVTVLTYETPKITALSVERCTSTGTASASGAYLKVTFSAAITSLNSKNTAQYVVQYKKKSATSYTSVTQSNYTGTYAISAKSYVFAADTASSYDIIFMATDAFSSTTKTATGSTVSVLHSILKGGLGLALGKVSEKAGFEVNWASYFYKDVYIKDENDAFAKVTIAINPPDLRLMTTTVSSILASDVSYTIPKDGWYRVFAFSGGSGIVSVNMQISGVGVISAATAPAVYLGAAFGDWIYLKANQVVTYFISSNTVSGGIHYCPPL